MPTYDYVCEACSHEFEELQKMLAAPFVTCPKCKVDALKRKIGCGSGLNFVGSGFYCTDYGPPPPSECCPCGETSDGCSSS